MSSGQKFKNIIDVANLILYSELKVLIFWKGQKNLKKIFQHKLVVILTTLSTRPSQKQAK
jgi:hypothetical protein